MAIPEPIFIDFETFAIEQRPDFPPQPVGVSIKWPGKKSKYYAWGHPTQNTHTEEEGLRALKEAWHSKHPLGFHNGKFDVAVATECMGLPVPKWDRMHDTLFLLFLHDPYAANMRLKDSANRILGMAPDEQEAVRDWLIENRRWLREHFGINLTPKGEGWAKYIAYAPGRLVGKYAQGDTDRTALLFAKLYREIMQRDMVEAYDTERELMPILLANEREGMRVDHERLASDFAAFKRALERCDEWIGKRVGVPGINVNSDKQMADALYDSGIVTDFVLTGKGNPSMSKDNLTWDKFNDQRFRRVWEYRNKLSYSVSTFMTPWLVMADASGGLIHTAWNQVARQGAGAVTGRMSSSPNFQNITNNVDEDKEGPAAYRHPKFPKDLPHLPSLRSYILPDKGQLLGDRDFSQQELRILAHYEDGPLAQEYLANPDLDVHVLVQGLLAERGADMERKKVKGFNFGILYGMGATGLSTRLGVDKSTAKGLIATWNDAMPGVANLIAELKETVRNNEHIVTWGGRQYGMPPPITFGDGGARERDYVLLNYLIQGSGADATKRAIIEFHKKGRESRMLASVHDEILFSAPKSAMRQEMAILNKCITSLEFDIPMASDGKTGKNWGEMVKFKD